MTFDALVCMPTAAVSSASAGIRGLRVETYTEYTAGMERVWVNSIALDSTVG